MLNFVSEFSIFLYKKINILNVGRSSQKKKSRKMWCLCERDSAGANVEIFFSINLLTSKMLNTQANIISKEVMNVFVLIIKTWCNY